MDARKRLNVRQYTNYAAGAAKRVRFHCGTSFSINIWEANEENKKTNKYKEGGVQKFYFFAKTMGLPSLRRSHDINNEDNKTKKKFWNS